MSPTEIILIVVGAVALIAVIVAVVFWSRHQALKSKFGPEYDRAAAKHDGVLATDRHLREVERKHQELKLKELDAATRERYATEWKQIQSQFVEAPEGAIEAAHELVSQLIAERGYPTDNRDEQLEQLSVEHARTLGNYRDAREIHDRHRQGEATTEDLRQALVHYRALFADLLGENPVESVTGDRADATDRTADDRTADDRTDAADRADSRRDPIRN